MEQLMRRMTHRLTVLGAVGGLVLAMPSTAAVAGNQESQTSSSTECTVQHADGRGRVTGVSAEREGAVLGQFRCVGGQWVFSWAPFERDDSVNASEIQVDPAGAVTARRLTGPGLSRDLTLAEMATIAQAATGRGGVVVERAVVAVDDGRQRTPEQIEALLAGSDTTGAQILGVFDRFDATMSANDLIDRTGGTPDATVVYFRLWDDIAGFFEWVVETLVDIGTWLHEHCDVVQSWDGQNDDISCRFWGKGSWR
jgi:hypothetical protein